MENAAFRLGRPSQITWVGGRSTLSRLDRLQRATRPALLGGGAIGTLSDVQGEFDARDRHVSGGSTVFTLWRQRAASPCVR